MSKRILAALGTVLAFAAVLVAVPLADSEPAEAHTETVQRCIVDPPINHCWTERVSHTHHDPPPKYVPRHGPVTTTTTTAPPPDLVPTRPVVRPGRTPTTAVTPPQCPAGQHRHGSACHSHPPPTTAPPPTTTTTTQPPPPPRCSTGYHRYGDGCHAHGFAPPCGTGTWVPHAGHTTKQRPPCPTTPDESDDGNDDKAETGCGHPSQHAHDVLGCHPASSDHHTDTVRCGLRSAEHRHDNSGCHPTTLEHCDGGEHTHGERGCHPAGTKHGDDHATDVTTCAARGPVHHSHDGLGCHRTTVQHCHPGEHAHNGGGCHPIGTDACPPGQHEHLTEHTSGCHPTTTDHYPPQPPGYWDRLSRTAIASLLCGGVVGAGALATGVTGGAGAVGAGALASAGCSTAVELFVVADEREKFRMIQEAKRRHAELVDNKNQKDRPSGSNTPSPTPHTTAPPTSAPPSDADVDAALKRFLNGDIGKDQYNEIRRRRDCAQGWADACAAPGQ